MKECEKIVVIKLVNKLVKEELEENSQVIVLNGKQYLIIEGDIFKENIDRLDKLSNELFDEIKTSKCLNTNCPACKPYGCF